MAKRKTIIDAVTVLAEAFGRKCTDATFEAYMIALADLPDTDVAVALKAALRSSREFMPTPGQLRELAMTEGRGVESLADQAWLVLCNAVTRHGSSKSVNFRDALINATVRLLGGWPRCCQLPTEEFEKWYKRDFLSTYVRLLSGGCDQESSGYLPGTLERENAHWVGREYGRGGKRYELPAPVDIGCNYQPSQLSSPNPRPAIYSRSDSVPQLEIKRAT